ncbi:SDR family NAD(P)-dependent oxidoreductase [Streptomyces lividans]|uniref:Putative oxidoreductase n=1 Tax=Streptomyces lividans 1326 TaxID=1200984 RepID=A0A7U9DL29_STRLI|nr:MULTISPECIES: SDR family NAD(P)-dependent oxidoreductase [Streptomyces]EOY44897.1 putative oxidoreductase [Streptomyces lividans 1326]KKD11704.1 oxidoreductase [Streptomyces sp. WM6391]MDX3365705.1 SDR family NAD(P)-dependent oxidoreductase [Streptomyces sp. ME02-6987-2C]MDX3419193.1 SDR family NAD(P)-dependent oxidoreductase [Streptomyces sp. ME02-6985-2c]WTC53217.1 SDR family NAD(P)-dependent oxidoreductase [Streptomyces anthocyanicus]
MTDLRNKTALITGSDRGIGRVIALRYARLGARVVVNGSRSEDAALRTVEEIRTPGAEAVAVQGDVADLDAPRTCSSSASTPSESRTSWLPMPAWKSSTSRSARSLRSSSTGSSLKYFAGPLARRVSGQHLLISGDAPA